jgi:hypothetical protein
VWLRRRYSRLRPSVPRRRIDRLLTHKQAVFDHLVGRWRDLFNISYDVLLYDLTSTYFEADPPSGRRGR